MIKYIARLTVFHLLFIGILYQFLYLVEFILPFSITNPFRFLITAVLSGFLFFYDLKYHRPIPRNPIEEFLINFYIAAYGLLVAFGTALLLDFALLPPETKRSAFHVIFAIYYALLLGLVARADYVEIHDLYGREYTVWQALLKRARKDQSQ